MLMASGFDFFILILIKIPGLNKEVDSSYRDP